MATVQVLADVEVLKCDIQAGIQKDDTNTTVVVYGKAEQPAPRVSLTELTQQFANMVSKEDLNKSLPKAMDEIQFSLRHAYYKKVAKNSEGNAGQNTAPNDYALWLDIYADELTDGWPVKVNKVSLKVWQTANEQVLEDMEITAMQKLLN